MMRRLLPVFLLLLAAAPAMAQQDVPDPAADARMRFGPLALTPTVTLVNAGIDTNVFDEPASENPKRDFTMTLEPKTDWWLRTGRTWFFGTVTEGLVYYNKYASERSVNGTYKAGWRAPLNRLTFEASGIYLTTRDRPGFEIDARTHRTETTFNGLLEIRALSKTFLGIKGSRQLVDYDKDATFLGQSLHDELNRTVTDGAITFRHQLTPLTNLVFDVGKEQTRFNFSPLRDADSTLVTGGIKFDPLALVKGTATFGYQEFKPLAAGVPGYKGSTAAVDLTYIAATSTKLLVRGKRDVEYSYDVNQPYYLQSGVNVELSQRIFGPVDIVGRGGIARLDYRAREGADVAVPNRVDTVQMYGGGIGYRVGKSLRIGFNADEQKRKSRVALSQYEGLRLGTSVSYGF